MHEPKSLSEGDASARRPLKDKGITWIKPKTECYVGLSYVLLLRGDNRINANIPSEHEKVLLILPIFVIRWIILDRCIHDMRPLYFKKHQGQQHDFCP